MYYIYMLRCGDGSVYTGIAPSIENRMKVHFNGGKNSSKYVASKGAKALEIYWECNDRSEASKLEYRLKKLPKYKKEDLISGKTDLEILFAGMLDCEVYRTGDLEKEELKIYKG